MPGAITDWFAAGGAPLYAASLCQHVQGLQEGYTIVRLLGQALEALDCLLSQLPTGAS